MIYIIYMIMKMSRTTRSLIVVTRETFIILFPLLWLDQTTKKLTTTEKPVLTTLHFSLCVCSVWLNLISL